MLQAALRSGSASRQVTFEVFARRLPAGRRFGVLAGTGRLLDALDDFHFDADDIAGLLSAGVIDRLTAEHLSQFRFRGDIDGYAEGEAYTELSPVLTVRGTFGETVLLETLILSVLNHDSAVASAAARMVIAAAGRPCIEMGGRRTHELAAVAAARAAFIAGFDTTSNLAAGARYGIPTTGTSAHAFTLVHDSELEAFQAQVASLGASTTLLVDTYDIPRGIDHAVAVAGPGLGAVRLDSGDLISLARSTRMQLDRLGATGTRIVVTSDLDEHAIAALAAAPVDAYGVGTSVVTGAGAPTAGFVYKLVARQTSTGMTPVAKTSVGKASRGGAKTATRLLGADGIARAERLYVGELSEAPANERRLQQPLVRSGSVIASTRTAADARRRWEASLAELPEAARALSDGDPAWPTEYVEG